VQTFVEKLMVVVFLFLANAKRLDNATTKTYGQEIAFMRKEVGNMTPLTFMNF
jgi:hypothetical protein